MGINRSSDTLSRCDPNLYSNLYGTQNRPEMKGRVHTTPPIQKDTIEISHDKLKEEALNRLRHTSKIVIAQNSFMRIGRYLFLAVAMPPYFLLYGLPKWIMVEAIPALFAPVIAVWVKVQKKVKETLEKGSQKIGQGLQWTQRVAHVLIQPIVQLFHAFQQQLRRFVNRGFQFFRGVAQKISVPGKRLANATIGLQKRFEKAMEQATHLASKLQESVQWMKQVPLSLLSWGQLNMQKIRGQTLSKCAPLIQRWRTSRHFAQKATDWASKRMEKGTESLRKMFQPMATFYRNQVQPFLRAIQNKCKGIQDFFNQKQKRMLATLENKQKRLKQLAAHHLIDSLLSKRWLPNHLKAWLQKWLALPVLQTCCQALVKLYSSVAGVCLSVASFFLQVFSKISTAISKLVGQFFESTRTAGRQVGAVAHYVSKICRAAILNALYYTILYVMMGTILLTWIIRSIGKTVQGFESIMHTWRKRPS